MKSKNYEEFVDKFKPKRTTDDCYTPPEVYDVVINYVRNRYDIDENTEVVRPFYPGGDYKAQDYTGKIVVDNPPFSIFSEIVRWYVAHDIKFFLFAPHLTMFHACEKRVTYIVIGTTITYDNKAKVNTSFITNLGDYTTIETAPELAQRIKEVNDKGKHFPKYVYPDNLITTSKLAAYAIRGISVSIPMSAAICVKQLDAQRKQNKQIFGAGFLVADEYALKPFNNVGHVWELSEAERRLIDKML